MIWKEGKDIKDYFEPPLLFNNVGKKTILEIAWIKITHFEKSSVREEHSSSPISLKLRNTPPPSAPEPLEPHSLRSNLFASLVILRNISFSFKIRFEKHFSFSRSVKDKNMRITLILEGNHVDVIKERYFYNPGPLQKIFNYVYITHSVSKFWGGKAINQSKVKRFTSFPHPQHPRTLSLFKLLLTPKMNILFDCCADKTIKAFLQLD